MSDSKQLSPMHRTIVVGVVWNRRHQLLLCRMSPDRGVFPGLWGLPGGGIEPGERMEAALRRELMEEIGTLVQDIRPWCFKDGLHEKLFADGSKHQVYMIFLLFHCHAADERLRLGEELSEYRWFREDEIGEVEINQETADTLRRLGGWSDHRPVSSAQDAQR